MFWKTDVPRKVFLYSNQKKWWKFLESIITISTKTLELNALMLFYIYLRCFEAISFRAFNLNEIYRTASIKCFHKLLWKFLACYYKFCYLLINAHIKIFPCACTVIGIPEIEKVKVKEELKQVLKHRFFFYVILDCKISTYLKNKN